MKKNNIKAIIIMTIVIIINVAIIVTLFVCHTTNNDTYTVHGKVVTTVSNGYCAVVDDDGEEWALYTDNTVECGDRVVIVLDNMGTNTIYDDEVVGIVME
jgi:hypothetical protein